MRTQSTLIKKIALIAIVLSLAACSTTRHNRDGDGSDLEGGGYGMGGNGNGTYTEGAGAGGFQPAGTQNCNVPSEGGRTQPYYFAYDSSEVHPDDMSRLQTFASAQHGALRVVGNTDNRGSREYNIALGWRRANSVSSALKQAGVSTQKINTSSNGAEKPIAFGTSDEDFQCNRRVDVTEKG